jgi:alpha-tubulin suppressor-like RCC1 family protein
VLVPTEVHGAGDVGFLDSVIAIMGGEVHNVAFKADGTVWSWGNNFFGQVGNATTNDVYVPRANQRTEFSYCSWRQRLSCAGD